MTENVRRLGLRPDAIPLDAAAREIAARRERLRDEVRAEHAAWTIAARVAYARALHAEEGVVISLACEVARAVLGREAEASTTVLRAVTARAMERARRAEVLVLRVHPDDAAHTLAAARTWLPDGMDGAELHVLPDVSVGRGGVVLDTELGRIDARLEVQIAEVARILEGCAPLV